MRVRVGNWLINKRKTATTAGHPLLYPPDVNTNAAYAPAGSRQAKPFIEYPVQFQEQKHVNMCGEASVKMLLQFHGRNSTINMSVNPRGVLQGADLDDLVNQYRLTKSKFSVEVNTTAPTNKNLAYILAAFGPVICSGEYCRMLGTRWGHYVLLCGVWDDLVIFQDPWHGANRRKPVNWFVPKLENDFAYLE